MYFRGISSDKKTKLAYSNGISQVNLPSPFSDGGNRKAYKTRWKLSIIYQQIIHTKTEALQRRCRIKYCRTAIAKP